MIDTITFVGDDQRLAIAAAKRAQGVLTDPGLAAVITDLGLGGASKIGIVAADLALGGSSNVGIVATNMASVIAAGGSIANINLVAPALGNIASVVANLTAITNAVSASALTGSYANAAATNVPRGLVGAAISNAGSGMTNGLDKVVTWAGGNMTANPVVWFDVVGGVMTNVRIKDPGLYIGSSITLPTPTIPGAAGGAALTLTSGFLIGGGQGYWVASADGLSLIRYKNVAGVATLDTAFTSMALGAAVQKNANRQIRTAYSPGAPYVWPTGTGEEVGDTFNDPITGYRYIGAKVQLTEDTPFNAVLWRVWASNAATPVDWKVYIRNNTTTFNPSTTAADASGTIPAGSFPIDDTQYQLNLGTTLFGSAGQYVMIFFRATDDLGMGVKSWAYDAGTPRTGFLFSGATGWNGNWSVGSYGGAQPFGQVAPRLLLLTGEAALAAALTPSDLLLAAPTKRYGLASAGRNVNIYFDALVPDGATNYTFSVEPTGVAQKGLQQDERWTLTPTLANSSGSLTLKVKNRRTGKPLAQVSVPLLIAAASAQTGTTKTALLIGDSLTKDGTIGQTLLDNASTDVMAVTLIGTQTGNNGNAANKNEGYSGQVISYFNGASSPFYFSGAINFGQYYTNNNGGNAADYVFIQLGTNNIRALAWEDVKFQFTAKTYINDLTTLIANVRAGGAGTKIVVALPMWTAGQDAWGQQYATDDKSARAKRNYVLFYQMMIAAFGNSEGSGIYLVSSNSSFDPLTAWPRAVTLRHSRVAVTGTYTTYAAMQADLTPAAGALYFVTNVGEYFVKMGATGVGGWRLATDVDGVMRRQTDALHPPLGGGAYKQIADEWFALMKYLG